MDAPALDNAASFLGLQPPAARAHRLGLFQSPEQQKKQTKNTAQLIRCCSAATFVQILFDGDKRSLFQLSSHGISFTVHSKCRNESQKQAHREPGQENVANLHGDKTT